MAKQTKKVTKRRVRIVEVGVCKKCTMYLEKFMSAMTGMVMELVSSSDFQEERDIIKMKLKEIFSNV